MIKTRKWDSMQNEIRKFQEAIQSGNFKTVTLYHWNPFKLKHIKQVVKLNEEKNINKLYSFIFSMEELKMEVDYFQYSQNISVIYK